jgi:hypothetical protein
MNIGIIAEGKADIAVIQNILACFGFDSSQIIALRSELKTDEYDKNIKKEKNIEREFGSWTNVMNDCKERDVFENFFLFENNQKIIIHLDTKETDKFEVTRITNVKKQEEYFRDLRQKVKNKINEWLENNYTNQILYAIAIEEIDAWVLTIYSDKNTCIVTTPKETLRYILKYNYKKEKSPNKSNFDYYLELTEPFKKKKSKKGLNNLIDAKKLNISLSEFLNEIEQIENK